MTDDAVLEILKKVQATLLAHTHTLAVLQQDNRVIRGAFKDLARQNVTPGEILALHADINRLQAQFAELDVRVNQLEAP